MPIEGMNLKQNLERVIELTKHDAAEQHIDLYDPANLFTVWAGGFFDRVQYCGSCQSFDAALRFAGDHKNLKELYVVYAGPKAFGILQYEGNAALM